MTQAQAPANKVQNILDAAGTDAPLVFLVAATAYVLHRTHPSLSPHELSRMVSGMTFDALRVLRQK